MVKNTTTNRYMAFNITLIIIIVTCLISYQAIKDVSLKYKLAHVPYKVKRNKEYYRFISSGFVHADYMHLGVNMFVLFMFGGMVESSFDQLYGPLYGRFVFVLCYILTIIAADLGSYFRHQNNPHFVSLGASGATSGILFISIALDPWNELFLFLIPIPIPAFIVGIGYVIYSYYADKKANDRINHAAHLYGALFGLAFFWITQPQMIGYFYRKLMAGF